jgi:Type I phosphodiesterase / nucleotide pyrophosphatase
VRAIDLGRLPAGTSDRKVLVIGLDGVRFDRLEAARTPVLQRLVAGGMLGTGLIDARSPAKTESGPGWSTVLTGTGAAKHGVRRNSFHGARYDRYPSFFALARRVRPDLSAFAALDWPPLADKGLLGPGIDVLAVYDGETHGFLAMDHAVIELSVRALGRRHPDASFVYLGCVDEAGHADGPLSGAYAARLADVDVMVGRLVDAVRARDAYPREKWLFLLTTDHGHRDRGGHGRRSERERAVWIIAQGAGIRAGARVSDICSADVAVTALDHLGVSPAAEWGLDGRSLLR